MNKTTVGVLAAFLAAVVGWLAIHEREPGVLPVASASASVSADAGVAAPELLGEGGGAPIDVLDGGVEDIDPEIDAGFDMPDGGLAELSDAPKSVQFGVVLVQFKGAQGAKADARSYEEAKAKAAELAVLAKEDFAAAVKQGDPGSDEEVGRMYRNILEPAPEVALFSLEVGGVSDPVDTPRGIWILKRTK
jgi:hypothetical protein